MRKKALIVGGEGMLGSYLVPLFKETHDTWSIDIVNKEDLYYYGDVRDRSQMQSCVETMSPDVVINLAAITDLEECERDVPNCYMTNAIGSMFLCDICEKRNIDYVYISTAGIYDGEREFYVDHAKGNPLNAYGMSKYLAEVHASKYIKAWVFRAGWMMGGGIDKDKKFVGKVLRQVRDGATKVYAVNDKLGAPTYALDFAKSIYRHVNEGLYHGVYNMVCTGSASRYEVALEMKRVMSWENVEIVETTSETFDTEYFAKRPKSEVLVNRELDGLERNYMREWKTCLKEYLTNGV